MKTFNTDQELYDILVDYGFVNEKCKTSSNKESISETEKVLMAHFKKGKLKVLFHRGTHTMFFVDGQTVEDWKDFSISLELVFSFLFYSCLDTEGRKNIKYLLKDKNKIFHIMDFFSKDVGEKATLKYKRIHSIYKERYKKEYELFEMRYL